MVDLRGILFFFFFQAEDGIRDAQESRGLGDVYKRQREEADRAGIASAIVVDAGLTEIPAGTITALGLGPAQAKLMDKVTGKLKLV